MGILSVLRRDVDLDEEDDGLISVVRCRGGITAADQPAGELAIYRRPGSSFVELLADDGDGNEVVVFLDYNAATQALCAIGAGAVDL